MKPFRVLSLVMTLGLIPSIQAQVVDSSLSFFITSDSIGSGGNFGGLSGADAHCQKLAAAVNAGSKIWRAYLSTQPVGATVAINARDRIGTGPWFNASKVKIASNLTELHTPSTNMLSQTTGLDEKGQQIPASPNRHDIITGTRANGMAYAAGADSTCANWTSSGAAPARAMLGHFNRMGVAGNIDPASWVEAHISSACTEAGVKAGGGAGYFYCFAANGPSGIDFRHLPKQVGSTSDHAPYVLGAGSREEQVVYRFALEKQGRVEVSIFDLEGHRRAVLVDGMRGPGKYQASWNGTDSRGTALPAGIYMIVLKRDGQIQSR